MKTLATMRLLATLAIVAILSLFASSVRVEAAISYTGKFGSQGSGNGQFNPPFGIGVNSSGNVYVSDNGSSYRI